jgi:DtxR family Mn-dependent transcriptional regulator
MDPILSLTITLIVLGLAAVVFWPDRGIVARWQRNRRLSNRALLEDALKHFFKSEVDELPASIQSIAGTLSVGQDEAAGILAELESLGLLAIEAGAFRLTQRGREHALRVIRAHRLWERYLSEHTGFDEAEWHNLAERQEHELSSEQIDALAMRLGNPSHDPHGDPIPTAEGGYTAVQGEPLSGLEAGETARIVHIEDEPAVIYSQIRAEGLHNGLVVRVLESNAERVRFWANGDEHILAPLLANNISVVQQVVETDGAEAGVPLDQLEPGERATVLRLSPGIRGSERRRLMDLGLLPGTEIRAELRSPSGDPTAYLVRGALLALRDDQARHIRINLT